MLVPFLWMILTAFKTKSQAISVDPFYFLPNGAWHWENFSEVWNSYNFFTLYINTIIVMALRVVCALLTATMAGYAFGRLNFPGKKLLFAFTLMTMLLTGFAGAHTTAQAAAKKGLVKSGGKYYEGKTRDRNPDEDGSAGNQRHACIFRGRGVIWGCKIT